MATPVDELFAILGYKLEGEEKLKRFQNSIDETEEKTKASAARMRKLGVAAGAAATAGIALTSAAVVDFANYERAMTRIGITAGATADETIAAGDHLQRLAKDVALPIDQALAGLDTLVSSGLSLEEAMAFLPTVLRTAQASGAATQDIANTAIKAASALKLNADQMQEAFDIMVAGGKAGQFELRDMAAYIPELANSFASLGYSGEEGLKQLIALLQTLREDTGTASAAATQAQNIFGKMFANDTAKKFKDFGIDLRKEMDAAKKSGEDAISAFVRLSKQAIDGDLSKLPQLFVDQEFRLGMQSLITSGESFEKFLAAVNGADVDGSVLRDLGRVLTDTEAQIQRLSSSWDRFLKALGGAAAEPVGGVLDAFSNDLDREEYIKKGLAKRGESWLYGRILSNRSVEEMDRIAREGGYVPAGDDVAKEAHENVPYAYEVLGRRPGRPVSRTPPSPEQSAAEAAETEAMYGPQVGFNVLGEMEARIEAALARQPKDSELNARLSAMNANLADMATKVTGQAGFDGAITDARTDARNQSVNVEVGGVKVEVQSPDAAPATTGAAVGAAVGNAAVPDRAQITAEPAF